MLTFKQKIQNLIFPLGSVQKIRKGYLKNYRIRLSENSLWSPLIGGWEPAMQKIMVNTVQPGQTVYDLGANNGLHGLLLAGLVGDTGMVINFEALPDNIKEINENFALNNITNYKNVPAAVTDQSGTVQFEIAGHAKQGSVSGNGQSGAQTLSVASISLDDYIEQGNAMPSFIKMDIEGAEGAALQGFARNIEKCFPLMIIELHSPEQDALVGQFLKFYKYEAYRFDPFAKLAFEQIKDFDKTHPHPEGIWGSIFCTGPGTAFSGFSFSK